MVISRPFNLNVSCYILTLYRRDGHFQDNIFSRGLETYLRNYYGIKGKDIFLIFSSGIILWTGVYISQNTDTLAKRNEFINIYVCISKYPYVFIYGYVCINACMFVCMYVCAHIMYVWTPSYGQAKAGRPARTYTQRLCEDTGCNPGDLPEAMNDREKWREMVKDIHAGGTTWWWWWWNIYIYVCVCVCLHIYIYVYIYIYILYIYI